MKAEADKAANDQKMAFEDKKHQDEMALKNRELDMRATEGQAKADADMISQGLPPGYNFAQHQEQMSMLAASVTQGQQQTAQALAAMAQGLAMMAQAQAAPKRVVRGPDGAVMGVETVSG